MDSIIQEDQEILIKKMGNITYAPYILSDYTPLLKPTPRGKKRKSKEIAERKFNESIKRLSGIVVPSEYYCDINVK